MSRANYNLEKYAIFRFDAGSLSLNFVATVRHRGSRPRDLLSSPVALDRWFHDADLPITSDTSTLDDYKAALLIRASIHEAVTALVMQEQMSSEIIAHINSLAAFPTPVPQLDGSLSALTWTSEYPVRSCFALIARDAILLIGQTDRQRLKMCAHSECQMLFLDDFPLNKRRWCSMSICGNREKVAAHRQRKRP